MKNKKSKHPSYIVEKVGHDYKHFNITHKKDTKIGTALPLYKNPNPLEEKSKIPAYFIPKQRQDNVNLFKNKNKYKNWTMSKEDKKQINKFRK